MTVALFEQAEREGRAYGLAEATLMKQSMADGTFAIWPPWSPGAYCGAIPTEPDGTPLRWYESVLEAAAESEYDQQEPLKVSPFGFI